ncbi:zinc finger, GRF-type containing protein [Tanacetum coccineum]
MPRCARGLEAVIRTPWTNRNPGRRFYGFPTLSLTCVNFLRWYDPPMCQMSVQIIPGLLRSRNKLEEILAMVEEKRRKLLKFLIISWTQKEAQQANKLSNLTRHRHLLASVNYRHAIIEELERLPENLMAYKTREHLKRIQKGVLVEVIKLKKDLCLQLFCGYVIMFIPEEYIRKVIEDVGEDDDFTRASWLSAIDYVNVDEGIMTGCFGDVKRFLKNWKLEKVVAVIKSCTPNALGDLTLTLKDFSGTISDTIHYKVLTEERFAKAITVGAALILHNVSVFSPKQSTHHYLNITKKNMVKVFHKDGQI